MIVDVHNHIDLESWIKPLLQGQNERTIYQGDVPLVTYRSANYQVDERVEGMERAGIDISLVYRPSTWKKPLEECREVNNYVGRAVKKYPKQLAGTAHIPPLDGEKAFDELRRCVQELGLKAALLSSSINGLPLDSRELWPFYQELVRLDIPLFVHPEMPLDYKLCNDYDLQRIIGREFDLMLGATRMVYGGVFEEFPKLKVAFSHLGGGISGLKGRLRAVQPWVQRTDHMKKSFDANFNNLYFDTAGFIMSTNEIRCALINIGPDRLLFGTDYPADYNDYDHVRQFKEKVMDIPMEQKDLIKIMGENAARLLRL